MEILSWKFLLFAGLTLGVYWLRPLRPHRRAVLLCASLLFLGLASWPALVLILLTGGLTFLCGLKAREKSGLYWLGVSLPLLALAYFKYAGFLAGICGLEYRPLLAVLGISFYTFRVVSYLTDVRRGSLEPERGLLNYLCYVTYFPQLVSGPIERGGNFLAQAAAPAEFDLSRLEAGTAQILWGLFKKLVVADNLAALVNGVFGDVAGHSGFAYVLAALAYTFQIYCDFSGYSDMAIGLSRLFGLDLMENFRTPYFAGSLREFWGRWHISLSTWFRDYVYIPLGGSRCSALRCYGNLMATFLLSGLWHGAAWTFIVWGGLHGLGLVAERLLFFKRPWAEKAPVKALWAVLTLLLVVVAWIFFRAGSLGDAWTMCCGLGCGLSEPGSYFASGLRSFMGENGLVESSKFLLPLLGLLVFEWRNRRENPWPAFGGRSLKLRVAYYCLVLLAIFVFRAGETQQMIYGQF